MMGQQGKGDEMENEVMRPSCGGPRFLMMPRVRSRLVCSGLAPVCSSLCDHVCAVSNCEPNSSVVFEPGMG